MNIYVARHGQTDWNAQGILLGNTDKELNAIGKDQAIQLKNNLGDIEFDYIISSPLKRAYETASTVSNGIEIIKDYNLRERNYGKLEGTKPQVDIYSFWDISTNRSDFEVETLEDFLKRVSGELDSIIQKYNKCNNILIVTHHGVAMAIDTYFKGVEGYNFRSFKLDNCEYNSYEVKPLDKTLNNDKSTDDDEWEI